MRYLITLLIFGFAASLSACGNVDNGTANEEATDTNAQSELGKTVHEEMRKDEPQEIKLPAARTPTEHTIRINAEMGAILPLDDQQDFEDAQRGFIGAIDGGIIKNEEGRVVWDLTQYEFIDGEAPGSVNPSLWRQSKLNMYHGLFEVVDGLYQVRGYDLAVMTVIRGETGWILIDPLTSKETSKAALELVQRELGERPVSAVLITHSHGDHFGGIRGVVSNEDIENGSIPIIAPDGFTEHAIAENVIAGPAMTRRAQFQFGFTLPASAVGRVDAGIGKGLSSGVIGFADPNVVISPDGETRTIDGIEFVFVNAAGTEAPAEFMFYLPQFKALHTAELATATMHNILTLRGAEVRDSLLWAKSIDKVLQQFGDKSDVVLASHNWPTWGAEQVREYLRNNRDTYRWIHDQTMRLANLGYTMHEIADAIGEPEFMKRDFSTRGYYGTMNHNSKATYQRYFGWWDGNPANLNPHTPEDQAKRMVELAGGADKLIENAAKAYEEGDYRWVATITNHLVFADPENEVGRAFLASAYEQLGYQSESSNWRNYYLSAANEVREGVPSDGISTVNADFVKAVPTADFMDVLAARVSPTRSANGHIVNFTFRDTAETIAVEIADGVASQRIGDHIADAKTTVSLDRADLDEITLGLATFDEKLADGSIQVEGDVVNFVGFLQSHDQPDPSFNVVTP